MEEKPPLEMVEARFFDELKLPEWQRRAFQDPRLASPTLATLLLASQVALLADAVAALVATLDRPDEED